MRPYIWYYLLAVNVLAFSAMGLDKRTAAGTIRISFGPETVFSDIDALAEALLAHKNARFPML